MFCISEIDSKIISFVLRANAMSSDTDDLQFTETFDFCAIILYFRHHFAPIKSRFWHWISCLIEVECFVWRYYENEFATLSIQCTRANYALSQIRQFPFHRNTKMMRTSKRNKKRKTLALKRRKGTITAVSFHDYWTTRLCH